MFQSSSVLVTPTKSHLSHPNSQRFHTDVSKNRGENPPNHPFVHRVFHYKPPSILGGNGTTIFGSTPILVGGFNPFEKC